MTMIMVRVVVSAGGRVSRAVLLFFVTFSVIYFVHWHFRDGQQYSCSQSYFRLCFGPWFGGGGRKCIGQTSPTFPSRCTMMWECHGVAQCGRRIETVFLMNTTGHFQRTETVHTVAYHTTKTRWLGNTIIALLLSLNVTISNQLFSRELNQLWVINRTSEINFPLNEMHSNAMNERFPSGGWRCTHINNAIKWMKLKSVKCIRLTRAHWFRCIRGAPLSLTNDNFHVEKETA